MVVYGVYIHSLSYGTDFIAAFSSKRKAKEQQEYILTNYLPQNFAEPYGHKWIRVDDMLTVYADEKRVFKCYIKEIIIQKQIIKL